MGVKFVQSILSYLPRIILTKSIILTAHRHSTCSVPLLKPTSSYVFHYALLIDPDAISVCWILT